MASLSRRELLALDGFLASRSYLCGARPGRLDGEARARVEAGELTEEVPHLRRWFGHLSSWLPAELTAPPPDGLTLQRAISAGGQEARQQVLTDAALCFSVSPPLCWAVLGLWPAVVAACAAESAAGSRRAAAQRLSLPLPPAPGEIPRHRQTGRDTPRLTHNRHNLNGYPCSLRDYSYIFSRLRTDWQTAVNSGTGHCGHIYQNKHRTEWHTGRLFLM